MSDAPRPTTFGTFALLASLVVAYTTLGSEFTPASTIARQVALIVAAGIGASILFDLQIGFRNVVRTDLVCIGSLYVLTLVELISPQPKFDELVSVPAMEDALKLVLLGFAGLAIGRHVSLPSIKLATTSHEIPSHYLANTVFVATFLAALHMLLATGFNPVKIFDAMVGPRFSLPWGRMRFGGWRELLNELGLLFYLIPPLTAILTIRRREIGTWTLILVWFCCLFTMFKGFAGGTRSIFLTHLLSFTGAYLLCTPGLTIKRFAVTAAIFFSLATASTYYMLEFRRVGLKNYLANEMYDSENSRESLSIDNNVISISQVTTAFPNLHPYLGWEIPIWAIVKPIPRAIWPGKPKGLSISIEEAVGGNEGYTVSTTYVGEAYMAFGPTGVIAFSLLFGVFAATWNRMAGGASGSIGTAIFASGFFAAAITTRSLLWLTTAILPSMALIILWQFVLAPRLTPAFPKRRLTA